jgi:hypothetical protein
MDHVQRVADGPSEPIERVSDDHITLARVLERRTEVWPLDRRT